MRSAFLENFSSPHLWPRSSGLAVDTPEYCDECVVLTYTSEIDFLWTVLSYLGLYSRHRIGESSLR